MKKILILSLLGFLTLQIMCFGQKEKREFDTRHYIGGSSGLQFGTVININVAPHYGFYVLPRLSFGIGGSYQYYSNASYSPPVQINIWGGSLFSRLDIIDQLYIHGEYQVLTYKTDMFSPLRNIEQIVSNNALIGAGYRQLFSDMAKDCAYIMILFNLNDTFDTPYTNPVFRIGLEFHF
jgi:hypothetical protein